jgi:hypothetical protein
MIVYFNPFSGLAQRNMDTKIISKNVAYTKHGFSHGLGFFFKTNENVLFNYGVSAYVNDLYLQNRIHIDNQFSIGFELLRDERFLGFSPLLYIGASSYRFSDLNRLSYVYGGTGYTFMIKFGKEHQGFKKWRFVHSTYFGWANEIHWSGEKHPFLHYSINLGLGHAFR